MFQTLTAPQFDVVKPRRFVLKALRAVDSYKLGHESMYPEGLDQVIANWTPRNDAYFPNPRCLLGEDDGIRPNYFHDGKITFLGTQMYLHKLVVMWEDTFFSKPFDEVFESHNKFIAPFTGGRKASYKALKALHDYGRLPITILALDEGVRVRPGIPTMIVHNTIRGMGWLTNYLETMLSAEIWGPSTAATISGLFRTISQVYGKITGTDPGFLEFQNHDFSPRGMNGIEAGALSGPGHSVYSRGTDNLPAVDKIEQIYHGDETFVAGSVPASEHSVMTMGGRLGELDIIKSIVSITYKEGIVSIVVDGFDYWRVISEYAKILVEEIRARLPDAMGFKKVVFRPDSGNPVKILTGTVYYATPEQEADTSAGSLQRVMHAARQADYSEYNTHVYLHGKYYPIRGEEAPLDVATPAMKGSVQVLAEIFGSEVNAAGYNQLSSDVGLIYGDSITPERAIATFHRLMQRRWCTSAVVLGIGSFTYQYVTRDTLGHAAKATAAVLNNVLISMIKEPATDKSKRSAEGLLQVVIDERGEYALKQNCTTLYAGEMKPRLIDGYIAHDASWAEIVERATSNLDESIDMRFGSVIRTMAA